MDGRCSVLASQGTKVDQVNEARFSSRGFHAVPEEQVQTVVPGSLLLRRPKLEWMQPRDEHTDVTRQVGDAAAKC